MRSSFFRDPQRSVWKVAQERGLPTSMRKLHWFTQYFITSLEYLTSLLGYCFQPNSAYSKSSMGMEVIVDQALLLTVLSSVSGCCFSSHGSISGTLGQAGEHKIQNLNMEDDRGGICWAPCGDFLELRG